LYVETIPHVDKLQFTFELGEQKFAKWQTNPHPLILELHPYVHRQVSPLELVFEFDAETYDESKMNAYYLANTLEALKIPFNAFFSGNRSVHIHVFYDAGEWSDKTTLGAKDKLNPTRLTEMRKWLFNYIVGEARGYAQGIDKLVSTSSRHMVRECGSRHQKTGWLKTWIGADSKAILNTPKPVKDPAKGDVAKYPDMIVEWMVPEWLAEKFLSQIRPPPKQMTLSFEDDGELNETYEKFCQKLLASQLTDKRKRGCFILAGFMKRKNTPKEQAIECLVSWGAGHLSNEYVADTVTRTYEGTMTTGLTYIREVFGEVE
jgi:hypothetical protein